MRAALRWALAVVILLLLSPVYFCAVSLGALYVIEDWLKERGL